MSKYTLGFITILAMISLFFACYMIVVAEKTRYWQKTAATVTDITIKEYKQTSSFRNQTPMYTVIPEFTYHIKDQTYHSNQFRKWQAIKSKFTSQQSALTWFENSTYSLGSDIKVYVNPSDYNDAVIIQGAHLSAYTPILLGIFLFILSVYTKRKMQYKILT